jgi:murein DD-endopeptidase MepM/ murein hydrolase activator NlpD
MRLRNTLLLLWAMLLVGGACFYLGRYTTLRASAPVTPSAEPQVQTRARTEPAARVAPAQTGTPAEAAARAVDLGALQSRTLTFPVPGVKTSDVLDTFYDKRGSDRIHEATDIMAARGVPVLAVDDGVIKKLFLSVPGGKTIYQFDPSEKYCYYYAHLDAYAPGIEEGMNVRRGQTIGFVGSTGNASANAPHLHFGIFELGPEKQYWKGTPINPYPLLMRALGH